MATYVGRSVNPSDNGSLSAQTVTITPVGSLQAGDLLLLIGLYRDSGSLAPDWGTWPANGGGQYWTNIGGPLNGFGCSMKRFWAVFNGSWTGNLLTANQASLETDTTGWAAETNCTIARTSAGGAKAGSFALSLTSLASGNMSAVTPTGTSGIPVVPFRNYHAQAYFKAATTARSILCGIYWYDSAGNLIGSEGTVFAGRETTTGFLSAFTSNNATPPGIRAPAKAAFAAVRVEIRSTGAASEVHYVDGITFADGTYSQFFAPGSTDPVMAPQDNDGNFITADALTGLMLAFRPSAAAVGWELEAQTFSFIDDEGDGDCVFPAQTITRYQTVSLVEYHRDILHTFALQSSGWLNPSSETQWRNTAGSDCVLTVGYQIYNTLGTTGDIINRATPVGAFVGSTYMDFYELIPPSLRVVKPRAPVRASRW